mgnify:CR=1 FL=1
MRDGYSLLVKVDENGYVENEEFYKAIKFKDAQQILMEYRRAAGQ